MGFWIRNAVLAVVLIGLAAAFFIYKDVLLASDQEQQTSIPEEQNKENTENTEKNEASSKPKKKAKSKNSAADGLSNFYAKIYGDKEERKIRNNVIFLPDPHGDIVEILQAREMVVRPYRKNWQGSKESRPFRKGETLYQKLVEYSGNDGVEILWWLNKDFIVKEPFRIDKNIVKTARQIGQAVSGHFPEGINSYFCYRQRTIVFISEAPVYLDEECIELK